MIAKVLIQWHTKHGRKNLPWQKNFDPYNIWVSEIMLQQTQVATVIEYYQNFLKKSFLQLCVLKHSLHGLVVIKKVRKEKKKKGEKIVCEKAIVKKKEMIAY